MAGRGILIRREHNELAWAAWHTAALGRAQRMPKMEKMLSRESAPQAQTSTEIKTAFRAWMARTQGSNKSPEHA